VGTTATTLRDLARAFARGELGRDEYRRSRSELVASILSGEVAVKNLDFPPPIHPPGESQEATEPRPRRRRPETPSQSEAAPVTEITPPRATATALPPAASKPAATGAGRLIAGAIVVVLGIGVGAFFIGSNSSSGPAVETASQPAATTAPAETAVPAENPLADAGRALIAQFLQDRNWSAQRLAAFQSDWSGLIADQQAAALKSADAGRLASAIYQRLLEERALSGLGDPEASLAKQRELVAFAGAIGISDPRLSVPEPPAAAADAAPAPASTTPN
jgi:hypothetical protein